MREYLIFNLILGPILILYFFHSLPPLSFSSIQFSHSVVSNSLSPQGLQHASLPVHHQLPELAQIHVHWVGDAHPTISSFVVPFSSRLQSLPASESFQVSQFFALGSQSSGVSASVSVLPVNIQGRFPSNVDWVKLNSVSLFLLSNASYPLLSVLAFENQ